MTYNFLTSGEIAWIPYMLIKWPIFIYPTCPAVIYTQDFGLGKNTTFTDGSFPVTVGELRIFGIANMEINTENIYNVTLENRFQDSFYHNASGLDTTILSLPSTFDVSRG